MSDASDTSSPQPNGAPTPGAYEHAEDEISLLDVLVVIARNRRLIAWTIGIITGLGLLYALFASPEYTATARVVRETEAETSRGISGGLSALRGLGINLGGVSTGLTAEAYPEILKSREVRLAVVRDTFQVPEADTALTFVDYTTQGGLIGALFRGAKRYTIGLPGTIMKAIEGTPERPMLVDSTGTPIYPTEKEEEAMETLDGMVSTSTDLETGLMTITVTTGDSRFSADVAASFIEHLTERVRALRTEKARQNLAFIEERFAEAQDELRVAEERLVQFLDRNKSLNTAQLQTERDRLQRQVDFKADLYSDLQTQLTQAEIDLQRSEPVITVVEEPLPPMKRSAPQRTLIVLLSFMGGILAGIAIAFMKTFLESKDEDDEEYAKLIEIKQAFVPARLLERVRKRVLSE